MNDIDHCESQFPCLISSLQNKQCNVQSMKHIIDLISLKLNWVGGHIKETQSEKCNTTD